jgi:ribosomal protein S18 acetylase RimI-like enzyme
MSFDCDFGNAMRIISFHNKDEIERLLRRNVYLHLYSIGDLDDFFWKHTTWYGFDDDEPPVLLYSGANPPVLLALTDGLSQRSVDLLRELLPLLPRRFYAHLSENLADVLKKEYRVDSNGAHFKMGLTGTERLEKIDTSEVLKLENSDIDNLKEFYQKSYPGNWFDPRMLETGFYYGIRNDGKLISAAGVHVYSPVYKVAALGNITTDPDWRGRGLGTKVSAKLCKDLLKSVDHIGLNVKANNKAAIASYEKLGFEKIAVYEECFLEAL